MPFDHSQDTIRRRIRVLAVRNWEKLRPRPVVRRAAGLALLATAVFLGVLLGQSIKPGLGPTAGVVVGALAALFFVGAFGIVSVIVVALVRDIPRFVGWAAFAAAAGLTGTLIFDGMKPLKASIIGLGFTFGEAILFGAATFVLTGGLQYARWRKKLAAALILFAGIYANWFIIQWFLSPGSDDHLVPYRAPNVAVTRLDVPNPGDPGPFPVKTLTYGSGTDWRAEFGADAEIKTPTVDATQFTKGESRWRIRAREWYWGFDLKHLPLNGRVWYPNGPGPFPLVLIVHGNHSMEEHSDPGYGYLGEHLASHGYILVSVDENFLNGTWSGNLVTENDARAWILLKHLERWREWNELEDSPFLYHVDLNSIALIGHSRGGEAAATAAAFNRLDHYPDNATVEFDFNFNIKSVIAIAPSDGQYMPAGRWTPLENVNYFTIHGAHDADVSTFRGDSQYNRVTFTDGGDWFKASLYIYRANHGQFNTVWGDSDISFPFGLQLNRKPLLTGEQQRQIARVYFTAFLDATLKGQTTCRALFRDHRTALEWLPKDYYITRYEDPSFVALANFAEDIDVTTGSLHGVTISGDNLAVWREQELPYRNDGSRRNSVVYVGWRKQTEVPKYSVRLPETHEATGGGTHLVFAAAQADEKPPKRDEVDDGKSKPDDANQEEDSEGPLDFSVRITQSGGGTVDFPVSRFRELPPMLKSRMTKTYDHDDRYGTAWEPTLQSFSIPLTELGISNPATINAIAFVFDQSPEGVLILDNIGFANTSSNENGPSK